MTGYVLNITHKRTGKQYTFSGLGSKERLLLTLDRDMRNYALTEGQWREMTPGEVAEAQKQDEEDLDAW